MYTNIQVSNYYIDLDLSQIQYVNNNEIINIYNVYLLQSISNPRRTYIGYTVDVKRRLRQHNGEIQGGAKRTSRSRPWKMICYISGFPDSRTALQFEWCNNHPKQMKLTKRNGVNGRIKTLNDALMKDKFASTSIPTSTLNLKWNWLESGYRMEYPLWNIQEYFPSI